MTDLLVAVCQKFESGIQTFKQHAQIDRLDPPIDYRIIGIQGFELKPPAQCDIEQRDRAVCRIHRAVDIEIGGNAEHFLAFAIRVHTRQLHFDAASEHTGMVVARPLVALDQCDQLSKHLRDIGAVDFVDEERIALLRVGFRQNADLLEYPVDHAKLGARLAIVVGDRHGPQADHKIFVRVRWMKCHESIAMDRPSGFLWPFAQGR